MRFLQQPLSVLMAFVVLTISSAQAASTPRHIVSLTELQDKLSTTADSRVKNVADIERVLSYPAAASALKKSGVNQDQMRVAVSTLSDDELTRLSDRARASEKDVEGGLIFGILALIGLIVVVAVVIAIVAEADVPQRDTAV